MDMPHSPSEGAVFCIFSSFDVKRTCDNGRFELTYVLQELLEEKDESYWINRRDC